MSPEAQRIALAKLCGWKPHPNGVSWYQGEFHAFKTPRELPDYLADLNAIHEAEKRLTPEQSIQYALLLHDLTSPAKLHFLARDFAVLHTRADQRAKAILLAAGEWRDGE